MEVKTKVLSTENPPRCKKSEEQQELSEPNKRPRRSRTCFTHAASLQLEASFLLCQYPNIRERERLAEEIGLPEARVHVWFQNRRSRMKRGIVTSKQLPGRVFNEEIHSQNHQHYTNISSVQAPQSFPVPSPAQLMSYANYAYCGLYPFYPGFPFWLPTYVPQIKPSSPLFSPGKSPTFDKLFDFKSLPFSPIGPSKRDRHTTSSQDIYQTSTPKMKKLSSQPLKEQLPDDLLAELISTENRPADDKITSFPSMATAIDLSRKNNA